MRQSSIVEALRETAAMRRGKLGCACSFSAETIRPTSHPPSASHIMSSLISVAELNADLKAFVIVDCRFDLADVGAGERTYHAGHIPRAVYAHLDRDLSGAKTPQTGRHPLPEPHVLAATFGGWGISEATRVVAYDADTGMFASRLWWLLKWLGHASVQVLDGGFKAWQASGLAVSQAVEQMPTAYFQARAKSELVASTAMVAERIKEHDWRVLDARASERFRGDVEPIDTVAGHIPGARNHPFVWNLGGDGRFLTPEVLRQKFLATLDGAGVERTIAMCGSGVTACHNLLAMDVAGLDGAKLYAGSWSEWIREPSRPVAADRASS
jgi:thiosulfate/3-mercaptopyruvate sulfurtransferase